MTTDTLKVQTKDDAYGNSYTTNISNDKLTNQDFLKLLLEEMKMQDPTKPMDSNKMLDSQMQMSSIDTNMELAKSMEALKISYAQSSLSTAANVIGKNIEDGNMSDQGYNKTYTVMSVENKEGEIFVRAQELLFLEDNVKDKDGNKINYDLSGYILDSNGKKTGNMIALTNPGQIALDSNNKVIVIDRDGKIIEDDDKFVFELTGDRTKVYSDEITTIPFNAVTKIF
ncbi:MAG: flagellar biosynthesis protein FlgD [Campylobacteraceae bacterium]|nr:flagellar biosynthesis protein FlgD [Campylobacteraceae bacterium]